MAVCVEIETGWHRVIDGPPSPLPGYRYEARDLCGWRRSAITIEACGINFEKPLRVSPSSVVYRMGMSG
jgi:hypothetical protein